MRHNSSVLLVLLEPGALRDNSSRGCLFWWYGFCKYPKCRVQCWLVSIFRYTADIYLLYVNIVKKIDLWCCVKASISEVDVLIEIIYLMMLFGGKYILGCLRKIYLLVLCEEKYIWSLNLMCWGKIFEATIMNKTSLRSCREANMFKAALLYIYFCFKCMLV